MLLHTQVTRPLKPRDYFKPYSIKSSQTLNDQIAEDKACDR